MHRAAAPCLLALAAASWAAAEPGPPKGGPALAPLRYLRGRALDLLDVVELNVGAGPGAKLSVKYGLHFFGLGSVRSTRAGNIDRRAGTWRELDTEFGILPLSVAAWPVHYGARAWGRRQLAADAKLVAQAGSEGIQYLDRKELNGDPAFIVKDTAEGPVHTRWADSFPIGAEVHAYVGIRALVRPLELVDFAVGLVGLDLDPWLATNPGE